MPLFPAYNALFIHIPKNAGRSIEAALFPEGVGSGSGRRSPLNRAAHLAQSRTANPVARDYLVGTRDAVLCAQHLALAEIELMGVIPDGVRSGLFTFCVVRDPFTRAISSVMHFRRRLAHLYRLDDASDPRQIERALEAWAELEPDDHNLRAHRRPQADFVFTRERANAMDMVLRFERLGTDFEQLAARIGANGARLPWVGRSLMRPFESATLYTPRARRIVERLYAADLELFGYRFGQVAA